jgi:hypothetical protein
MSNETENSPVKPTIIDLDPDQVLEDGKPTSQPDAKPAAPPVQRTRVLPVALATLVIGGIGGGWLYRDALSTYFPSDNLKRLSERVEVVSKSSEALMNQLQSLDRLTVQLKTDVDSLESASSAAAANAKTVGEGLASLRDTVTGLESAVAETKATVSELANRPIAAGDGTTAAALPADLAQRIAALEKDVSALKTQKSGAMDRVALSQSLSDLKAKIGSGVPFADEQARIARMVPAAAGLDVLSVHAAQGLPNANGLATELAALKSSLPKPSIMPAPSGEKSWWDAVADALSTVITIRDAAAIDWQVVADKAIAFAEAGDLAQAVAAIDDTEEAAPASLQQWRDRAAARLTLESALASISESITRTLATEQ